ncbi:MAG: hypothetical protein RLZZ124_1157 [Cyanobacteriota bacterium]
MRISHPLPLRLDVSELNCAGGRSPTLLPLARGCCLP